MYRSQYPDGPSLFSNVRRPYRPTLLVEIGRTWYATFIGIAMVSVGIFTLVYNEGRTVSVARALDEGQQKITVPETIDVVFEENNGKLVLVTGPLLIEDPLEDQMYGITIRAVKLMKRVQMYQWYEIEDRRDSPAGAHGGDHDAHVETTYSYDKDWFDIRIDSETFDNSLGHHNPESWPYNASVKTNARVKIGGFLLGKVVKQKFKEYVHFTSDERPDNRDIKMHAGLYFHAKDVWQPDVGDIRVHFSYAGKDGDLVTIIGKQSGREIRAYETEIGEELLFLHPGIRKPEEVFHYEHSQNRLQTWVYRVLGWFLMFLGYNCISNLLDIIIDDSPSIRKIMSLGVTSLPFSFALSTTLLCIGIGWILYRPLLGGLMLGLALFPGLWSMYRLQQRRHHEWRRSL